MKDDFTLIGHAPVDSGQLMLVDPSYIDSNWRYERFQDTRRYRHKVTGAVLQYGVHFGRYDDPILSCECMSMNQLLETGAWEEEFVPVPGGLSYNSVSRTTVNSDSGEVECAVAFRTGWGDGNYPVFARRNKDGRIAEVRIVFIDDDED